MSKYSELADRLEDNGCDCGCHEAVEQEAAAALRELEAFNDEHQSLHSLSQMVIEKLEEQVAEMTKAATEGAAQMGRLIERIAELEDENHKRQNLYDYVAVELHNAECLQDSAYLAGAKEGWNAAHSNNPHKAMAEIRKNRAGYLRELRDARAALEPKP